MSVEPALESIRCVRRVGPYEAHLAVAVLKEAAAWSGRFGHPIWEPASFEIGEYRRLAGSGELVGGFDSWGMATCMLMQTCDPIFWPDDGVGEAVYLHKLAVRRRAAGAGWPSTMIDYATSSAIDIGAIAVRLDTVSLPRMVELYGDLGFSPVDREPKRFGDRMMIRLERRL